MKLKIEADFEIGVWDPDLAKGLEDVCLNGRPYDGDTDTCDELDVSARDCCAVNLAVIVA